MRGRREPQVSMLTFADLEARVPVDHPLCTVKAVADAVLAGGELSGEFDRMCATVGRAPLAGSGGVPLTGYGSGRSHMS